MIYVFEDTDTAEVVEVEMHNSEVCGFGDVIEHEGRSLRRLVTMPEVRCPADRHFVDHTLPYNYPPHLAEGGKVNDKGQCLFDSPRQMRNLEARANDQGENIRYTGGGVHPLVKQKGGKRRAQVRRGGK